MRQEIILDDQKSKQISAYKEEFVILQSIGIIVIKSKEIRVITYTCRYSNAHFNPYILVTSG